MKKLGTLFLALCTMCTIFTAASCAAAPEDAGSQPPADDLSARVEELQAQLRERDNTIDALTSRVGALEQDIKDEKWTRYGLEDMIMELEKVKENYENFIAYFRQTTPLEDFIAEQKSVPADLQPYKKGSVTLDPGKKDLMEYRWQYYWGFERIIGALGDVRGCDYYAIRLPDGTEFYWYYQETLFHMQDNFIVGDPTECTMLTVIKDFRITREEFDQIMGMLSDPEYYAYPPNFDEEGDELPNADVLYTFDQDIINDYYRRT